MISPQFDIIIQCIDVVKALPIDSWDSQPRPAKRAAGLVGRWAIEKAFESAIIAHSGEIPKERTLVNLATASGVGLVNERWNLLATVDREVTATEPDETEHMDIYLDCCRLARGIVQTTHQHLTIADIMARKSLREKP
jgi:hypothetical protein